MPAVHRDRDRRACGAVTTVTGQGDVYINNKLVSVYNDPNTHGGGGLNASINTGTIFINYKKMVVQGSSARGDNLCPPVGGAHCNPASTSGSPDVWAFE